MEQFQSQTHFQEAMKKQLEEQAKIQMMVINLFKGTMVAPLWWSETGLCLVIQCLGQYLIQCFDVLHVCHVNCHILLWVYSRSIFMKIVACPVISSSHCVKIYEFGSSFLLQGIQTNFELYAKKMQEQLAEQQKRWDEEMRKREVSQLSHMQSSKL